MGTERRCKDCPPDSKRGAPYGGARSPRCYTHHKAVQASRKGAARALRLEKVYGLKPGQYEQLYGAQGGVCAICRRATGKTRALSVDHDHATGFVRGLLCSPCNKILGHLRDDPNIALGIYFYLENPPAIKEIGCVKPDE